MAFSFQGRYMDVKGISALGIELGRMTSLGEQG